VVLAPLGRVPPPGGGRVAIVPADLSPASAQMMAEFVSLLLKQAEQQAQARERTKEFERRESGNPDEKRGRQLRALIRLP
jgi:hypothetical protein